MPKIFQESTMRMIYDMVHQENYKRKEIADQLNISREVVDQIYAAAVRRFGSFKPVTRGIIRESPRPAIVRPKAEYSNKSYSNY